MQIHLYYVYILTNTHHTVLYTGVTNDLERSCVEHSGKNYTMMGKKKFLSNQKNYYNENSINANVDPSLTTQFCKTYNSFCLFFQ